MLSLEGAAELILEKFGKDILSYIKGIKKQAGMPITPLLTAEEVGKPGAIALASFLKEVAQTILQEPVEIRFYSEADNAIAKTVRGIQIVQVNLLGHVENFLTLYQDYEQHTLSDNELFNKHYNNSELARNLSS